MYISCLLCVFVCDTALTAGSCWNTSMTVLSSCWESSPETSTDCQREQKESFCLLLLFGFLHTQSYFSSLMKLFCVDWRRASIYTCSVRPRLASFTQIFTPGLQCSLCDCSLIPKYMPDKNLNVMKKMCRAWLFRDTNMKGYKVAALTWQGWMDTFIFVCF